jgi:hypothetical protein
MGPVIATIPTKPTVSIAIPMFIPRNSRMIRMTSPSTPIVTGDIWKQFLLIFTQAFQPAVRAGRLSAL